MVKKEVLESQVSIELPAREMLAFFNFSRVTVAQANINGQLGLLNISGGQQNNATVVVLQD